MKICRYGLLVLAFVIFSGCTTSRQAKNETHANEPSSSNYWLLTTGWGKGYSYSLPFFYYKNSPEKEILNILIFSNYYHAKGDHEELFGYKNLENYYLLNFYWQSSCNYEFQNNRANPYLLRELSKNFAELKMAINLNNKSAIRQNVNRLNMLLASMGINELKAPHNMLMIEPFKERLEALFGGNSESERLIIFPLYYQEKARNRQDVSVVYPLYIEKNIQAEKLVTPELLTVDNAKLGLKKSQAAWTSKQFLLLFYYQKLLTVNWKEDTKKVMLAKLVNNIYILQKSLYQDEVSKFQRSTQKSNTPFLRKDIAQTVKNLGLDLSLPETPEDCNDFLEKLIKHSANINEEKSFYLYPIFSIVTDNNKLDWEIFPIFRYQKSEKISQYSVLWRIFNLQKGRDKLTGHIFFIPFSL